MNYRQVTRKLKSLGCEYDRQGAGSHEIWKNTRTRSRTSIPYWSAKDMKPGTISRILRDLGVSRQDFDRA